MGDMGHSGQPGQQVVRKSIMSGKHQQYRVDWGFPGGSDDKESACNEGDLDSIPGLERSPGEGKGYPLQYSCLENSVDKGACWAAVHGVAQSQT